MEELTGSAKEAQDRIFRYLSGGRVNSSFLLIGPDRKEKLEIAKSAGKFFLCSKVENGFCGECSVCNRVDKGMYPDIIVLDDEESNTIKVERIREICHQMEIAPLEDRAKICIVDECHRMSTAAANAFLKTLEEPLPNRYFWLLTSQPGSLLPTILSRCIQFYIRPQQKDESVEGSAEIQIAFADYLKTRSFESLRPFLDKKEKAIHLLKFLEQKLHSEVIEDSESEDSIPKLAAFDQLLTAEGRLRSNANCGLMLENLLDRHF